MKLNEDIAPFGKATHFELDEIFDFVILFYIFHYEGSRRRKRKPSYVFKRITKNKAESGRMFIILAWNMLHSYVNASVLCPFFGMMSKRIYNYVPYSHSHITFNYIRRSIAFKLPCHYFFASTLFSMTR